MKFIFTIPLADREILYYNEFVKNLDMGMQKNLFAVRVQRRQKGTRAKRHSPSKV